MRVLLCWTARRFIGRVAGTGSASAVHASEGYLEMRLIRSSCVGVFLAAAIAVAGCGASSGASDPSTPEEVEQLSDQFNHDLYECVTDLGVQAKIVGDGIEWSGETVDGRAFDDCIDRLLQEPQYAFMNNAS